MVEHSPKILASEERDISTYYTKQSDCVNYNSSSVTVNSLRLDSSDLVYQTHTFHRHG